MERLLWGLRAGCGKTGQNATREFWVRWVLVVVLAGCGGDVQLGPAQRVATDRCGVAQVEGLVGQPFVALAEVALPGALRVLYPGQMVMAEVQGDRLNAAVDGAGQIVGVFCG